MESYRYPSQNETIKLTVEEKMRAYGKLAITLLAIENEKNPHIEDNPNIIPGTE